VSVNVVLPRWRGAHSAPSNPLDGLRGHFEAEKEGRKGRKGRKRK